MLFRTTSRLWEKMVKLVTAHVFVALPLTLVNLIFGPVSHFRIILDTFSLCVMLGTVPKVGRTRDQYGSEWWRTLQREDGEVANHDELLSLLLENGFFLSVVGVWVLYQALLLEYWIDMPEYYLWNVLCVW